MTPPELPKPLTPIEEQQVIAQQAKLESSLKVALTLINLGIQKYSKVLVKL